MIKLPYENNEQKDSIMLEQSTKGLILIEEQNISEGNFLIFSEKKPEPILSTEERLAIKDQQINDLKSQLQTTQEAVDFLLMGGM